VPHVIEGGFPERVLAILVLEGNGVGDMVQEVSVRYREFAFPAVMFEVVAQGVGDGENGFFPGGLIRLPGREEIVTELHLCNVFSNIVISNKTFV